MAGNLGGSAVGLQRQAATIIAPIFAADTIVFWLFGQYVSAAGIDEGAAEVAEINPETASRWARILPRNGLASALPIVAASSAFVGVAQWFGTLQIVVVEVGDGEPAAGDESLDGSVEVAATGDAPLQWSKPVLPPGEGGFGARPCSTKWKLPPGRRTRPISWSARSTSGMVHSVQVLRTWSTLTDARGWLVHQGRCSRQAQKRP